MTHPDCGNGPRWRRPDGPWGPPHRFATSAQARARFFRRIAAGVIGLIAFGVIGLVALAWAIADRVGAGGWTAAVPVAFAVLVGAFALVAVLVGVRGGVGPLREVMDAADRVSGGDYEVRVREHGPPAVRALAQSFNAMTGRLQHADRLRRDLMADVAHELRTPLSVLQGRLEGLMDGVYPRDDAQLAALLAETQVLSTLIEDLRTLALADAGALRLQPEPTDLVGLVRDEIRRFQAEASRLTVALGVATTLTEAELDLDPLRIRQVLTNLLSNALRHTPPGRAVTVTIAAAAGGAVSVAVRDEGEGIAAEAVPHIFDRFYKGEASRGSGLGLTIARRLIAAHGGEIAATSRLGQGTTVTFTLPAR